MVIDKYILRQVTARLARYWFALKECYLILNSVTHHALGILLKFAVVVYFLFCALVLGLRYVVLPNIDNYKPDIERMATQALGNKVSITGLDASWAGLRPQLSLDKVVIHDKFGNPALTLPSVSATLSWWSLIVADLRLHQLEINRPDMDVLRDAEGRLYVAGIFIDTSKTGDGKGADWILSQHEIVIRDGKLRWNDYQRVSPETVLENVDFVLRNRWRHHRFALKATPPAAFAEPLDVRGAFDHPRFTRSISDATQWKGEIYANVRSTDLAVWKAYADYPIDLQRGRGSVRAWLKFDHAQIADFTADLSLSNVSASLGRDLALMNLTQVNGRVAISEDVDPNAGEHTRAFGANGHAVSLTDFSLRTDDGLILPPTTISERFIPSKNGRLAKTEIKAKSLDLQALANFAERLPLPADQRKILAELEPRGLLNDFSAQWQGSYPEISGYNVKGQFTGLSLKPQPAHSAHPKSASAPAQAAVPAIPGFDNLTGRIEANDRGGTVSLASNDLAFQVPGYFAAPVMPFDHLAMQANWVFQGNEQLLLDVQKIEFVQENLSGTFSGKHLMPLRRKAGQSPGTIDINGRINRLELQQIDRYLPLQTPETLHQWLTGALVGGAVKDVRLRLKGDLAQFPFHMQADRSKGEFSVSGKIEDGVLNYAPGEFAQNGTAPKWPVIDQINGTILFDRARMEITADTARTSGTTLSHVKAIIPDLSLQDKQLDIDGSAGGPLQEFLRFTRESPVAGWIGNFTEETKATGDAKLALKLQLPLQHMQESKVNGALQFAGNTVILMNEMPPLSATNGKLEFHEKGFSIGGIKSNFLGGPVSISGGSQKDDSILVKAEGMLTADGIRKIYSTPGARNSSERITGSTRYRTTVRVLNGRPEILVESSMAGMALDFPEPLRKAANESLPLRFELTGLPPNDALVARDVMKLSLGSAISARYEREKTSQKGARWSVVRGGIGVNVPAPQPDSGLIASVSMKSLNIDAWRRALTSVAVAGGAPVTTEPANTPSIAQYIEPEVLAARATELIVMDRKLDNVVVGASHQAGLWQANIDSEQASGYITWAESRSGRGLGKVTARLASLIIPKSAASEVTELLEKQDTTTQMPAIDLVVENFELFGKKFGYLELLAQNARGNSGWEWRINKLSVVNADAELKATGTWALRNGERLSELAYTLNISDAGKLLDRFGFVNVLRRGKGTLEGELNWKGLPFSLDIPSLNGKVTLNLAAGQFLKVDPSAAKLLGVLSLQSLPRRLALDFRDVFSEGFAFDGVTATAAISQGVAKTDNFKMRGVAATVLIDGTADIAKEAQNLHVVVIPEINVGAASVVYGLAVNPVIGVGTFLAQLFLRDPLMKAFTFEYQVTGQWADPVVTKLLRQQPSPAGDAVSYSGSNG